MTFLNGDCLNILPEYASGSFDFILTDPPYLARYIDRQGRRLAGDDNDAWIKPAFTEMFRVLASDCYCLSFYGWPQADRFITAWRASSFRIVGHLVFAKDYASSVGHVGYRHECAYLLAKGNPTPQRVIPDVLPWQYTGNRLHPTQKPVSVLQELIETFSAPGDLVLDPFAGSGSSLIAARECGRDYFGIEIDTDYYRKAAERLSR